MNRSDAAGVINVSGRHKVYSYQEGGCYIAVETDYATIYNVYISSKCSEEEFMQCTEDTGRSIAGLGRPSNRLEGKRALGTH